MSRECLRRSAPVLDPPVFPDLRIEEQGRIVGPALSRPALVTGPVDLALALLPARGQAVESVVGGSRLGRCPPVSGRDVTGRGLRTTIGRVALALALSETGHGPRTATGLAGIALGVTGRGLWTATDHVDSARDPLLVGEVAVIPLAALVTARSHERGRLSPLTARCQRMEDGEPDVRNRRVWRRWLSPRLLLSLKRLLQWLLLLRGVL